MGHVRPKGASMSPETEIKLIQPPTVPQRMPDSCWAACLQSWSRAEPRLGGWLDEMSLVDRYGETNTGGITPAVTYPKFRAQWRMWADAYAGIELERLLTDELPKSHMMCAHYSDAGKWHAVLIWQWTKDGFVHFMDPDGGRYRKKKLDYFTRGAIARVSLKAA